MCCPSLPICHFTVSAEKISASIVIIAEYFDQLVVVVLAEELRIGRLLRNDQTAAFKHRALTDAPKAVRGHSKAGLAYHVRLQCMNRDGQQGQH